MFGYSKIKIGLIAAVMALGVVFALPNVLPASVFKVFPPAVQSVLKPVTLGLDLQGGSYLLMEVDTQELLAGKLQSLSDVARSGLRANRIRFAGLAVAGDAMQVKILDGAKINEAREVIRAQETFPLAIEDKDGMLVVSYTPDAVESMKRKAVEQSVDIVRRRIDNLGTKEPQIQQQGTDRIVVQLPGVQDPGEIKAIMGRTAKMTFHLVDEETSPQLAQMGKLSPDSMLMTGDETGYIVLKRAVIVSGADLDDARGAYDDKGNPAVSFSFKSTGAIKFGNATAENVGRRLAIVLDGKVISAPTIQSPIKGGKGIITGSFTVQSANDLALMLRSGALPASLHVIEERVVGPGLGEDSIKAGTNACLLVLVVIFVFMILFYGRMGIIADLTLAINGVLLLAVLSMLGATLTLPGLAGIALTIAMAVDANILIFERMKEEMHAGLTMPAEIIRRGFSGSFSAIFDGQLTTLFAALFLFWLGSGPVRGFGVTLGLGLVTTLFAAIFANKVLLMVWFKYRNPQKIDL
ncbi:MAG: protein translocase subunit SecD [Alphaproteobacteria bacterium]|nr:protein translocase subunit SecD [Alphaproteobacteria bacterium]